VNARKLSSWLLSAVVFMPIAYVVYFWGALHQLLGVPIRKLLVPFGVYCLWSLLLCTGLYYIFRNKEAKQRPGYPFYVLACAFLTVSSLLITYFGRELGLLTPMTSHRLYLTTSWGVPLIFLIAVVLDRLLWSDRNENV